MRKTLLALLLFLILLPCPLASSQGIGTVTASALALRTGPGIEYQLICHIPSGSSLTLLSYDASGWYRVGYEGRIGYASGAYIQVTETRSTARGELPDVSALIAEGNNPGYPLIMKRNDVGNGVRDLQATLQALGYLDTIDGEYGESTEAAVIALQQKLGLTPDGIIGPETRRNIGRSNDGVELLDWWTGGNTAFARFSTAEIIDVETGLRLTIWRYGGDSHADVEPFTAQDSATLLNIYGGEWSWDRRAIWLIVGGRVIAASMNGMPHDGYRIAESGYPGHFCIHLLNSRVHASNEPCPEHQAAVAQAYAAREQYH